MLSMQQDVFLIFCSENNLIRGSPLDKLRLLRFAPIFLIAMFIFSYLSFSFNSCFSVFASYYFQLEGNKDFLID